MATTDRWSSRTGFFLAAIGSAVGIGNIWRFSAVLGQSGGGAYLLPYLTAVFLFAMPLMILELSMGRHFRANVVSAFRAIRPYFAWIGWVLSAIVFCILSYYLVITGWTLGYVVLFATGQTVSFELFTGSYQPVLFFVLSVVVTGVIVSVGVQKGIERISLLMIPISILLLVGMAIYGVTLSGFSEAMRFLFTPDYSVLSDPLIWSAAFGQAFFSLSVGEGILLTYGAYVDQNENIPRSALVITLADLAVAILAGMVIFPIVFTFGLAPTAGAELAFTTLPLAFLQLPGGILLSLAFFIVLFFTAITSSISMLEVNIASIREATGWSRRRVAVLLIGALIVVGLPSALSYSRVNLMWGGIRFLDFMDETIGTLGLPIAAVLLSVVFTWFLKEEILQREMGRATHAVTLLGKYVVPAVLVLTTIARLVANVDMPGMRLLPGTEFIGSLLQTLGTSGIMVGIGILVFLGLQLKRYLQSPKRG
ncbi:MAG: sodium-dependent transporter [Methanomicrobiaceae archaeon]|nr:sodium-dependent transporter [Methanomicrobiaceae archaeon]